MINNMIKKNSMKKHFRLSFFVVSLILVTGFIVSCDSDNEESSITPVSTHADVTFYSSLPYASETRGYWNGDSFIRFHPKDTPPYSLMVVTHNDEGKAALKELADTEKTIIEQISPRNDSVWFVSSKLYFESPLFYVSNSYRTDEMKTDSYPIFILPRIVVKMKNGGDVSAIIEKYKDKLTYNPNSQILSGLTIFESNVNNSNDLLMLVEEIGKLEEVAWAEPDYSGGYHLTFLTRGRNNII
jgi:hypothetical protein